MAMDLKYEDKQLNLEEVIQFRSLPEVVRICNSEYEIPLRLRCRNYSGIEPGTEVMLQKTQKVKYARIKILKYLDKDTSQEEMDAEYVPEHEAYVGDEFLIPSKYRGKVKFVHRPGGRRRYTAVSQVLYDLPSLISVEEETECVSANDLDKKMYISANTTLKLKRKFQNPRDGSTYLECTDNDSNSFAFHQDDRINFTEVEDPKLYNLFELVRCQMLPKVIRFEKVPSDDAILVDTPLNSAMLSSTDGPIELLGFKDVEVLVSWIRDVDKREYSTVLIPKAAWNTVLVQKRKFLGMDGKNDYIEKQYDGCVESDFIEKCIYFMFPDLSLFTWLRHPNRFSEKENEVADHVPVYFPVSEQSVSSLPPCSSNKYSFWKNVHVGQKIFRKIPTGPRHLLRQKIKIPTSENVYQPELTKRQTSKTVDVPEQPTNVNPTIEKPEYRSKFHHFSSPSLSEGVACTNSGHIQSLEETNDKVGDPDYDYIDAFKIGDIHQENSCAIKQGENVEVTPSFSSSSLSAAYRSQTYGSDEYEIIGSNLDYLQYYDNTANNIITDLFELQGDSHGNKAEESSKPSGQTLLSADETYSGNAKGPKEVEDILRKFASLGDSDYVVMDIISDVSCVCFEQHVHYDQSRSTSVVPVEERAEINNSTKNPKLESVTTENSARLKKRNIGSADFFQYSVVEVEYCFKQCGLHEFASKCLEHRLDGNFFENFNIEILKTEPFFLTNFQCLKVKKIIYDGWRPNICKDGD